MGPIRPALAGEGGFTLIEVMFAIVLMTMGMLTVADVYPRTMALALYGKDQTRGTNLAQQQVELYRNTPLTSFPNLVGDYGSGAVPSQYFDQDGNGTTPSAAYFTRDVQIQYWPWNSSTSGFSATNPYTPPTGSYVYHVSVTTHWPVRGQTIYTSGNVGSPNGCVAGGAAVQVGLGCVTVSTFVTP
ncbi:MAG TPA: prepilin-type N-terminal cleavage/methylation domain-containing protein [bacterium]|nr:prepilin-type N-terminal cleavage/methylation domain-containing protein [bacterium]